MRKFFTFIMITSIILLIGCTEIDEDQSIEDYALEHMEKTYGDKFEYVSPWGIKIVDDGITEMILKSKLFDDEVFVEIERTGNKVTVSDNYLAIKYRSKVHNTLKSATDDTFGKSTVDYEVMKGKLSEKLRANASFEKYIKSDKSRIFTMIYVPEDSFDEGLVDDYVDKLKATGIDMWVRLFVVNEEQYNSVDDFELVKSMIVNEEYKYLADIKVNKEGTSIETK